ncbi:hydroxypyruvate isomerase family protein [Pollutibacter soli]|uniref:hydroxypyruvate isomerase family protein n=1 Tax=Pollutibacter soli TaxID=3034157 RepID=UPI003013343D
MLRRNFLQQGALAGSALLAGNIAGASEKKQLMPDKTFNLDYAFHDGMFAAHAGKDFVEQIKFGYDKGFRSIEDNGMMSRTPEEQKRIGDTLAKLNMRMGVFVVTTDSWHWKLSLTTGKQEWKDKMVNDCKTAVEVAKRCNAKWVTVVPGNFDRSIPYEYQMSNVIDALRRGAEVLEKGNLVMVLEPLSDNPDLFLRYSAQTYLICKAVNSPSCKILFDMYHMQRNEGNVIKNIDASWDEIGYLQIGDNPGRKEPTTGEMNYKNIFKHIHEKGWKGILGMEHGNSIPGKEGEAALIKAYRDSDAFM